MCSGLAMEKWGGFLFPVICSKGIFMGVEKQTEEGVAYGILAFVDDRSVG